MRYITTFLCCFLTNLTAFTPNGYCKVPLADLLSDSVHHFFKKSHEDTKTLYQKLPRNTKKNDYTCPRVTQLLYNDPVEIIEYKGNEVKIRTPQWKYSNGKSLCTSYWTYKEAIGKLTHDNINAHPTTIPCSSDQTDKTIVVLTRPWHCKKMHTQFSVGTRFVIVDAIDAHTNYYKVYYEQHDRVKTMHIPKGYAKVEVTTTGTCDSFLDLLRTWAHKEPALPYLLGGASYTNHAESTQPLIGFDCAKLITRAAQITGIPFYAANSLAFLQLLTPLSFSDKPRNGDIIFFKGHVALISDCKRGLLIEARGYGSIHGIVHEIPFSEQFKDIIIIDDLMNAYKTGKKITRLGQNNEKTQNIYDLKILRFS